MPRIVKIAYSLELQCVPIIYILVKIFICQSYIDTFLDKLCLDLFPAEITPIVPHSSFAYLKNRHLYRQLGSPVTMLICV